MELYPVAALASLLALTACERPPPASRPSPARPGYAAVPAPPAPPPPPAAPSALTLEEFARLRLTLVDEGLGAYFARCCTAAERAANPADHPLAAAERDAHVARVVQEIGAKVQAGRQRFDGAQAAACVAALRRSRGAVPTTCVGPDPFTLRWLPEEAIAACRDALVGTAAVGAACDGSDDCAPANYCARTNPRDASGRCAPRVEHGAACRVTVASCPRGDECVRGHCGARLGVGANCDLPSDCPRAARCNAANFCVLRATAPDHAPCTENADCRSDHCAEGRCQPFCSGHAVP